MGRSTRRGESQPKAADALLGSPGMATARLSSIPRTPTSATWATGTQNTLGMAPAISSGSMPAASANPVSTGPGHSAVTDTPCDLSSSRMAWL